MPKSRIINYPSFNTAILERASGTDTPAATNVRPMTVSGIFKVDPIQML